MKVKYEDFCRERECPNYFSLAVMGLFPEIEKRDSEEIKSECRRNCRFSAEDFHNWFNRKLFLG